MTNTYKNFVLSLWKAFAAGDEDQMRNHLAAEAIWRAPKNNATARFLGVPNQMNGRDEIVRFMVDHYPRMYVQDVKS